MRLMLDAADLPADIPPCDALAGYITGGSVDHVWSAEDWSRAKAHAAYFLPIHVASFTGDAIAGAAAGHQSVNDAHGLLVPEGGAVCIDVEHADTAHVIDSGYAAAWVGVVATAGFRPIVYGSASDKAKLAKLGPLWLAKWGSPAELLAGSVATQYDGGPGHAMDQSVIADDLVLATTGKVASPVTPTTKAPIVAVFAHPGGQGYWEVDENGAVFAFGAAVYHGGANAPDVSKYAIVGGCSTPSGNGYWLVASDGGVFTYGDAEFLGAVTTV